VKRKTLTYWCDKTSKFLFVFGLRYLIFFQFDGHIGRHLGKEVVVGIKNVTNRFLDRILVKIGNNIKLVLFTVTEI
jgi:hypothetical protein